MKNNFLQNVFSIKNNTNKTAKIFTIFGIKFQIKYCNKRKENDFVKLVNIVQKSTSVAFLHQKVFPKYKNIYQGKSVVLCGAGPSLNKYLEPIEENAVHIALNRAFQHKLINFDYIFAQDLRGVAHIMKELAEYKTESCIKFIGTQDGIPEFEIPESYINSFKNERFITDIYKAKLTGRFEFAFDLSTQPLGNFDTIAFPAMQFILWTNPSKIYIVGCDSAPVGHCDSYASKSDKDALINGIWNNVTNQWIELKSFAELYYPDTEIISVNPVGLKGIFKDIYTE